MSEHQSTSPGLYAAIDQFSARFPVFSDIVSHFADTVFLVLTGFVLEKMLHALFEHNHPLTEIIEKLEFYYIVGTLGLFIAGTWAEIIMRFVDVDDDDTSGHGSGISERLALPDTQPEQTPQLPHRSKRRGSRQRRRHK